MNEKNLLIFKNQLETNLRTTMSKTLTDLQNIPEILQGTMLMNAAGTYCKNLKNGYAKFIDQFIKVDPDFLISESEFRSIIDESMLKVLKEFVDIPDEKPLYEDPDLYYY